MVQSRNTSLIYDQLIFDKDVVVACLGYHNKIPQTEWLKEQKFVFLTVLETGSLTSRSWQGRFWVRPLWLADGCLAVSSHHLPMVQMWGESLVALPYKDGRPTELEPQHLYVITSLKGLSPNTVALGIRASTYESSLW